MKCEGKSTRTGEIECPVCHCVWDRGDEAPECSATPVLDETGPGGVLDEKTVRLGLSFRQGVSEFSRIPEYKQFAGRIKREGKSHD